MNDRNESEPTDVPALVDSSRMRELPSTTRGVRTRDALVAAARRVFERDGFLKARLTDITTEASCSIGSFYTYFDSKDEIFTAVLHEAQDEMMHPGLPHVEDNPDTIAEVLYASIRAYLVAYQRNAKLMLLLEQVATIDEDFRQLRVRRSEAFATRNAKRIAWMQDNDLADRDLDPLITSKALSSIVSRMAYYSFALGTGGDVDDMSRHITKIWLNALGASRPTA